MSRDHQVPLDSFETALLARLKQEIGSECTNGPAIDPLPTKGPSSPTRRRYAALVLAAAAITAIAILAHAIWPTPAFAVTGRNGREVTVKVMRLEGADQLEQALSDRGIPADVTYLPAGKECAPDRYEPVHTPGLALSVSSDWFKVTIPANAVGKGDTFVLAAAVVPFENGVKADVEFDIAHGPVGSCHPVDAP
jgi:hypothetical protein